MPSGIGAFLYDKRHRFHGLMADLHSRSMFNIEIFRAGHQARPVRIAKPASVTDCVSAVTGSDAQWQGIALDMTTCGAQAAKSAGLLPGLSANAMR